MNPGLNTGIKQPNWRNYIPNIKSFSAIGGTTDPILSDETVRLGRYIVTNQGMVKGFAQITFQSADTFGSGETVWGITLPYPASRSSGGADLPIGQAFLWKGNSANPSVNMIGQVSLMDPLLSGGNQTNEDYFAQVFLRQNIAYSTGRSTSADGVTNTTTTITSASAAFTSLDVNHVISGTDIPTGTTIASVTNSTTAVLSAAATGSHTGITFTISPNVGFTSGATSITVNHGMSGYTPVAYDIHIAKVNNPSSNSQWWNIANITSTGFDIVIKNSSTTTPAQFTWKIESEPNGSVGFSLLMSSSKPWTWAAGHSIGINFEYEARR